MTEKKIVDNSERPAQPEPGEDEAVQQPDVREDGGDPGKVAAAKERERARQTGEE